MKIIRFCFVLLHIINLWSAAWLTERETAGQCSCSWHCIHFVWGTSDSTDLHQAVSKTERSSANGVVRHSVEFHRLWGETRLAYSCFLPDTEGGRWRAEERTTEGGRKRQNRRAVCDVHWCSCSSRSNAASVLCSSLSRLPSAPLNYSQPEDASYTPLALRFHILSLYGLFQIH